MTLEKLLNSESKTVTSSAIILGGASLISRLLGLLRDRLLAHQFGAGDILDAYYAAFRIPDFIYNIIILGAISAGFIPIFAKYYQKDPKEGWRLANQILNLILISIALISVIIFFLAPSFIEWLTPGYSGDKLALTQNLTKIILLSPILLGISSIASSILQNFRRFIWYSLPPIFYNLGIIFGAVFLAPKYGPIALGWGVVLGAGLHLLIQLPGLIKLGFNYQLTLSLTAPGIKDLLKMLTARTLTLAVQQINLLIITFFASGLASGSLAVFNLANNLISVPIGIVGISFAIAIFPVLTNAAVSKNIDEYKNQLSGTIRQILFFMIPATIIFVLLRVQIVRVILGTGRFSWENTIFTMQSLGFLAFGLFAYSLIPTLTKAFYAIEDTKRPLYAAFGSTTLMIIFAWFLSQKFGVIGLALASAADAVLKVILLYILLRQKVGNLREKEIFFSFSKMITSGLIMALAIQGSKYLIAPYLNFQTFMGIFIQGLFSGLVGVWIYLTFAWLFQSPEMIQLVESSRRRMLMITRKVLPLEADSEEEILK